MIEKNNFEIWDYKSEIDVGNYILAVTTNGMLSKAGLAVMGKGIAKEFADRYPKAKADLGYFISHHCQDNLPYTGMIKTAPVEWFSFGVKRHFSEPADLELINWSTNALGRILTYSARIRESKIVLLPRPGCGEGGLEWEDVKPIVSRLPDSVWVVDNKPEIENLAEKEITTPGDFSR